MNDFTSLNENDAGLAPSVSGILHCLKFLAAEAASLKLLRTLTAIEDALEMAACESGSHGLDEPRLEPLPPVLH